MALEQCRASRDERCRRLPGDDLVPHPRGVVTHAITIDAPPSAVWPWLVQLGSGRAGWYAYDHVDNGGVPSARRIVPELQRVAVGDVLPWLPGARDGFLVADVIPERALVLVVPLQPSAVRSQAAAGSTVPQLRTSWALVLEPLDGGHTRLIARGRISRDWLAGQEANVTTPGKPIVIERVYSVLARLPWPLLLPVAGFGHYLMEARMLRGIKRRAEHAWAEDRAKVVSP